MASIKTELNSAPLQILDQYVSLETPISLDDRLREEISDALVHFQRSDISPWQVMHNLQLKELSNNTQTVAINSAFKPAFNADFSTNQKRHANKKTGNSHAISPVYSSVPNVQGGGTLDHHVAMDHGAHINCVVTPESGSKRAIHDNPLIHHYGEISSTNSRLASSNSFSKYEFSTDDPMKKNVAPNLSTSSSRLLLLDQLSGPNSQLNTIMDLSGITNNTNNYVLMSSFRNPAPISGSHLAIKINEALKEMSAKNETTLSTNTHGSTIYNLSSVVKNPISGVQNDDGIHPLVESDKGACAEPSTDSMARLTASLQAFDSVLAITSPQHPKSTGLQLQQVDKAQMLMQKAADLPAALGEGQMRLTYTFKRWDATGKQSVEVTIPRDPLSIQGIVATASTKEVRDRLDLARVIEGAPSIIVNEQRHQEDTRKQTQYEYHDEEEL